MLHWDLKRPVKKTQCPKILINWSSIVTKSGTEFLHNDVRDWQSHTEAAFEYLGCTLAHCQWYAKTRRSTANHVRVMSNAWILSHSMLTACSHGHCQKVCTPKNKAFLIVCLWLWSGSQFPNKLVIETSNLSGTCFSVDNWTYFYLLVAVRRKAMLSLLRPDDTPICWKDIIPCGLTKE